MSSPADKTTIRADARRNRERLLAAALELFARVGADVPLKAIASAAGVGIGTLYRHFPNREALFEAAYRNEVAQLCDVETLLRDRPPDAALAEWMDRFLDYVVTKRELSDALRSLVTSDIAGDTRRQVLAAIAMLLEAGVAAGTLRADLRAEDVLHATAGIFLMDDEPGWADNARRVLALVMDGLRHGAGRA